MYTAVAARRRTCTLTYTRARDRHMHLVAARFVDLQLVAQRRLGLFMRMRAHAAREAHVDNMRNDINTHDTA